MRSSTRKEGMKGTLSHELDVPLPAGELWEVYGTMRLADLAVELLPGSIEKVDLEQGDGGVGSVLRVTFPPGFPGPTYLKETFIKIDHEQRLKETIQIEGGMIEIGFRSYLIRFRIIEKSDNSSTIQSTIEYELDEEHASKASSATVVPFASIAEAVSKYLLEKKTT